mmetsp:Transcript_28479/g.64796  ORF Transcript_28479/g.64796 Transcript_28479/m.64796 type:complete len:513 (-) Transcript_28479:167-1705(-)
MDAPSNDDEGGDGDPDVVGTSLDRPRDGYTAMDMIADDGFDSDEDGGSVAYHAIIDGGGTQQATHTHTQRNGFKNGADRHYMVVRGEHHREDDLDSREADSQSTDSSDALVPLDFRALAEQALRGLDLEHEHTLLSQIQSTTGAVGDNTANCLQGGDFVASFPTEFEVEPQIARRNDNNSLDVKAIESAMKNIRLKSPHFATSLDEGASSALVDGDYGDAIDSALAEVLDTVSRNIESRGGSKAKHELIPQNSLASFRRNTEKAKRASSNLTRSAIMAESLVRLWPAISFKRRMAALSSCDSNMDTREPGTLVIQIVGADGVECSSEDCARRAVFPFFRWVDKALRAGSFSSSVTGFSSLIILMTGPCIPDAVVGKEMSLIPEHIDSQTSSGLLEAKVKFEQRECHETKESLAVDLFIAFNAGIWGYDSWRPTIAHMCQPGRRTLFVITAYTIEESEDDAEVIAEVAQARGRQLWPPERCPFSSKVERPTSSAPAGRAYYQNGAWQTWLLGC